MGACHANAVSRRLEKVADYSSAMKGKGLDPSQLTRTTPEQASPLLNTHKRRFTMLPMGNRANADPFTQVPKIFHVQKLVTKELKWAGGAQFLSRTFPNVTTTENRIQLRIEAGKVRWMPEIEGDHRFLLHEGFLATDLVLLNHGQVKRTTPELAPPLLTTTLHQRKDVSALHRFNVHRCPTRRVFSGTGLELMTYQPRSNTLTTGLPRPPCATEDPPSEEADAR
ncbi:uncharacterized protein TNCV_3123771 [Trichonephila clavipes]|nr:uncharacterized protein TNCV_3123771 [Trichonephila clavipes]